MSGYLIDDGDDDEIDNNYYNSDHDFTPTSNSRSKNYSTDNQKSSFEDVDSENFGKPITVTLPTENINKLQYESDTKQVSLNTKINQIIKNHLDWHTLANVSYIPKSIVTNAISQLTEQQLFEFAQSTVNNFQEMSLLLRGEFSFSSFLDILNTWLRITQTPSRFDETEHEYKIIIRHDMGYKYSFLLQEVFRLVIKERFHKSFHHNMTENLILIRSAK
jgi:hypothetical protein